MNHFSYDVPITQPGKYVIILKFTELYFKQARKRVFNIKFGDSKVGNEIDIYAEVGKIAAFDEYIEFEYKDGQIYYENRVCPSAFRNGKLRVVFEKIGMDNPKVDVIVLFQGDLSETDYSDIPQMRTEWDRRVEEENRKKRRRKI